MDSSCRCLNVFSANTRWAYSDTGVNNAARISVSTPGSSTMAPYSRASMISAFSAAACAAASGGLPCTSACSPSIRSFSTIGP